MTLIFIIQAWKNLCEARVKKMKQEMALARWKAKTEVWRHNEAMKMKREEMDLQRELMARRNNGREPVTPRAIRDDRYSHF